MKKLSLAVSWVFHPLFIPFLASFLFVSIAPSTQFAPWSQKSALLIPITILTILIPLLLFWAMRTMQWMSDVFAKEIKHRKLLLVLSFPIYSLVIYKLIQDPVFRPLYFYFIGISLSFGCALIFLFLKSKVSLHLVAMGALWMFMIGVSIHFEKNITLAIAAWMFFSGLTATARFYLKAHDFWELILGFTIGFISQLFLLQYWL